MFILRDGPQEGDPQHLLHVLDGHHVIPLDHIGTHAVDKQLDVEDTVGLEETSDTVCREEFRVLENKAGNVILGG